MRLVEHSEEIRLAVSRMREIGEKRKRSLARCAPVEMARIVLNAVGVADFSYHGKVMERPALQSFVLKRFLFPFQFRKSRIKLRTNVFNRKLPLFFVRDEVLCRKDEEAFELLGLRARYRIYDFNPRDHGIIEVHFVYHLLVHGHDFNKVSDGSKRSRCQVRIRALEVNAHELADKRGAVPFLSDLKLHVHALVLFGRAEAVDGGHRGDDDDVFAR